MQDPQSVLNNVGINDGRLERAEAVGTSSNEQRLEVASRQTNSATTRQRLLLEFPGFSLQVTRRVNFLSNVATDSEGCIYKHLCGFLPWQDAVALGSTNKTLRGMYLKHSHMILKPLLEILDGIIGCNKHPRCGEVYVPRSRKKCLCEERCGKDFLISDMHHYQPLSKWDPRFENDYDLWDGHKQCAAMVDFITVVVKNLRLHLRMDREDISDRRKTPDVMVDFIADFYHESDDQRWRFLADLYPGRMTMAMNIALIHLTIERLAGSDNSFCAKAACGNGELDVDILFEHAVIEKLMGMFPLDDNSIFHFIFERIHPPVQQIQLFGEMLWRKMFLAAPIMNWASSEANGEFEGVLTSTGFDSKLVINPPPMEEMERHILESLLEQRIEWDLDDELGDF